MAPEQFSQPRSVGPAADVFAMASVLVHAATGRGPFDSDSPYVVAYQVVHDEPVLKGIPEELRPLIERCLAKEPAERPSPDELLTELRTVSASYDTQLFTSFDTDSLIPGQRQPSAGEQAEPVPDPGPGAEPRRPHMVRKTAVLAVALVVLGTAGVLAAQRFAGGSESAPTGRSNSSPAAGKTFRAWDAALAGPTGSASALVACSYAAHALFCAQRGIRAARLNPDTGDVAWSRTAAQDDTGGTEPAPTLSDGVLRTMTPNGSQLEGLDPSTGKTRWHRDMTGYGSGFYDAGSTILLVSSGGDVTAIDGATGKTRWHKKLPGHGRPVFATYVGTAYAVDLAADGKSTLVSAIDPDSGTVRWRQQLNGDVSPVGASGGHVYFTSSNADGGTDAVLRYNPGDRTVRRVPLVQSLARARATVRGSTVYLLGYGGALLAVDTNRTDGAAAAQRWRIETAVGEGSQPVVVGDRLYFTAADGRLLAVDTKRVRLLGQTKPRLSTNSSLYVETLPAPLAVNGRVYATAPDGTVFAVDAKDPSRW
jgi:outer membrane protein assembly factor BamB